jgi:hypothetical protein
VHHHSHFLERRGRQDSTRTDYYGIVAEFKLSNRFRVKDQQILPNVCHGRLQQYREFSIGFSLMKSLPIFLLYPPKRFTAVGERDNGL